MYMLILHIMLYVIPNLRNLFHNLYLSDVYVLFGFFYVLGYRIKISLILFVAIISLKNKMLKLMQGK